MKLWFVNPSFGDMAMALNKRELGKQIIVLWRIFCCLTGEKEFQRYRDHPAVKAFCGEPDVCAFILEKHLMVWYQVKYQKRHGLHEKVQKWRNAHPIKGWGHYQSGYLAHLPASYCDNLRFCLAVRRFARAELHGTLIPARTTTARWLQLGRESWVTGVYQWPSRKMFGME